MKMRLKLAIAVLLLAAPLARAEEMNDALLTKGLLNLATMEQIAVALEYRHAAHDVFSVGQTPQATATALGIDAAQLRDPWGTPYRVEIIDKSYRIVGAGSDRNFDEKSWVTRGATTSLAADVVVTADGFVRSNRQWLAGFVTAEQKGEHAMPTAFPRGDVYKIVDSPVRAWSWLRINETELAMTKKEETLAVLRARVTQQQMEVVAEQLRATLRNFHTLKGMRAPIARDEWGTPLRIEIAPDGQRFRVISAGADRKFDEASWPNPIKLSLDEDLIYDNTAWKRAIDFDVYAQTFLPPEMQSTRDAPTKNKTVGGEPIYRVGGDVTAPVALVRAEMPYPPELDGRAKIGIAEVTVDAAGRVIDVKLLLGLSADADRMVADALKTWQFQPATLKGKPVAVVHNMTVSLTPRR